MKKFITYTIALLLTACSFGRSPNSDFYTMQSNGLNEISTRKTSIAVAKVKVPDMLDKSQIVIYEKDTDQVKILEFNRWAEVYPDIIQTAVINDLIAYLPNAFVKRTFFDSNAVNYNVDIEINSVKSYENDKVILSAWWTISNSYGRTLARQQGKYIAKVNGKTVQDIVNGQSDAVHKLSADIAEKIINL